MFFFIIVCSNLLVMPYLHYLYVISRHFCIGLVSEVYSLTARITGIINCNRPVIQKSIQDIVLSKKQRGLLLLDEASLLRLGNGSLVPYKNGPMAVLF